MKNKYSTRDKKITDQGWAAMQKILDREMPRNDNRPRAILWWLTGLLLLPLLTMGGLMLFGPRSTPLPPAAPVNPTEQRLSGPVATYPANQPGPTAAPSPTMPTRLKDEPAQPLAPSSSQMVAKNPSGRSSSSPARPFPTATTDIAATPSENTPAPHPQVSLEMPLEASPSWETSLSPDAEVITASGSRKSFFPVVPLPIFPGLVTWNRPAEILIPVNADLVTSFPTKPAKTTMPELRLGATTGLVMTNKGLVNGFTGGLSLDWKPLAHWGFQTGLVYRLEKPTAGTRPLVNVSSIDYAAATGDFSVLPDTQAGVIPNVFETLADPYVTVPVERLHRLEMPVQVFWQPVKKLRVYGGLTVSHLLATKSADRYLAPGPQLLLQNNQELSRQVSMLTTSILPSWQLDSRLGAGLCLGRHLEVNIFYRQTWRNDGASRSNDSYFKLSTDNSESASSRKSRPAPFFTLAGTYFF